MCGGFYLGKYFGTDGFRGEAGIAVTAERAFKVGKFLGWYFGARQNRKCRAVIGKDTRLSSDMIEAALTAGLCAGGADCVSLGVVPTPAVACLTVAHQMDAGVMISASRAWLSKYAVPSWFMMPRSGFSWARIWTYLTAVS